MRSVSDKYIPTVAAVSLVFIAIIWGSSYLVVKDILINVPPFAYLTVRYLMALPVVFFFFRRDIAEWLNRKATITGIVKNLHPGVWLGFAFVLQAYGLQNMGPGKAALLTALVFLFVPVIEFINGEKTGLLHLVPILVLASCGVAILAQPWIHGWIVPDILIVLCAVAFAFQIFLTGRVVKTTHFAAVFVLQGTAVLLISFLGWMLTEASIELSLSTSGWLRICYVALIVTSGCYLIQFSAQRFVRARYVGLIFVLEPVAALFLSISLEYEDLSANVVIGSSIILVAIFLVIIRTTRDQENLLSKHRINDSLEN